MYMRKSMTLIINLLGGFLRWILNEKYVNGALNYKERLVAEGFKEDALFHSTTRNKKGMCLALKTIPSTKLLCQSINIRSKFFQNKNIAKDV